MSGVGCTYKVGVVIPAAGLGARFKADEPKQYLQLAGEPILVRTIRQFVEAREVDQIVLVVASDRREQAEQLLDHYFLPPQKKNIIIAAGGASRQDSVQSGFAALAQDITLVLIHDGARPLVSSALISRCVRRCRENGAVIAAVPVSDTLKKIGTGKKIDHTLDRSNLYRAQTPQAAWRHLLEKAFARAADDHFVGTDEASLLEHAGIDVFVVDGDERNIKITRPKDLLLAEQIMATDMDGNIPARIGHGYDVHKLVSGRALILGGVEIPYDNGLLGHSDADVVTHAVMDALLGAAGGGDIGLLFPDSDPGYKNISSLQLLVTVISTVRERGYRPGNIDCTIVCQQPKLRPHIDAMRRNLSDTCGLAEECVNVKATTTEQLGFAGRQEGIAAHAVATLYPIKKQKND